MFLNPEGRQKERMLQLSEINRQRETQRGSLTVSKGLFSVAALCGAPHVVPHGYSAKASQLVYEAVLVPFFSFLPTKLCISVEPNDVRALCSLTTCMYAVNKWMSNNFLKGNVDIYVSKNTLSWPQSQTTQRDTLYKKLGHLTHPTKMEATRQDVTLDSDLNPT
ncbi:hypothetical protein N1851_027840 [Merluccius polli]|uniref:Uncharacterized protein n=1 Tax=Merluccius polli TaxID=89951 RepID=A0AA47NT63_MERPO|nr:hypothetical protein N1851_027840 [Merluccius polli]